MSTFTVRTEGERTRRALKAVGVVEAPNVPRTRRRRPLVGNRKLIF
jgi:hypothetical protein